MKHWIMRKIAEEKGIVAAITFLDRKDLFRFFQKSFPSKLDFCLYLKNKINLKHKKRRLKISYELSSLLLEKLEDEEEVEFELPSLEKVHLEDMEIHFFALPLLPKLYHHFLERLEVEVVHYIISFCELLWTDICSDLEIRTFLREKVLDYYVKDRDPLLANFGTLHKNYLKIIEDRNVEVFEDYRKKEENSLLHCIQNGILNPEEKKTCPSDDSLKIVEAKTKLHEIELLYEHIKNSSSCLVLAPEIQEYAPYIQMVFGKGSYIILGLEEKNSLIESFFSLVGSEWERRDVYRVFKGLKTNLLPDEVENLFALFKKVNIREGLKGHPNSWEEGLKRIDPSPFLDKFLAVFESLKEDILDLKERVSLEKWARKLLLVSEKYFLDDSLRVFAGKLLKSSRGREELDFEEVMFYFEKFSKNYSYVENVLDTISFCSIREGFILPAKKICLIGLDKELQEQHLFGISSRRPPYEKNFFLEALCMAEELYMSFVGFSDEGRLPYPSLVNRFLRYTERDSKIGFELKRKLPRFDDRKLINIRNIDQFTIIKSRDFGSAENPIFESRSVYLKDE